MLHVYTAQFRYSRYDRVDITRSSNIHPEFAPTWMMVHGLKSGLMSIDTYDKLYHRLMLNSYISNHEKWIDLLSRDEVTLVCYCSSSSHCHRFLLANLLTKLGGIYLGERKLIE